MSEVNIAGLKKASILASLYNASSPQGMGVFQARPGHMSLEQADEIINNIGDDHKRMFPESTRGRPKLYFDYLYGRPLKVDLSGDTLRTDLYNRDNGGDGAAERIIEHLRTHAEAHEQVPT